MAWFLEFNWRGKNAYPLLREKFKDPAVYSGPNAAYNGPDIARAELFKAFGYYVTESSKHVSTYVPYFRKRPQDIEKYKQDSGTKYLSNMKNFKEIIRSITNFSVSIDKVRIYIGEIGFTFWLKIKKTAPPPKNGSW